MSKPFEFKLSDFAGVGSLSPLPDVRAHVTLEFSDNPVAKRYLKDNALEFKIGESELDRLQSFESVIVAVGVHATRGVETFSSTGAFGTTHDPKALATDEGATVLAVVTIKNLDAELRFLKLDGTWTPVAQSIPFVDPELLKKGDEADLHFSVDEMLWKSLPVATNSKQYLKHHQEHFEDPDVTAIVTGTIREANAAARFHEEFFAILRKSDGDTVLCAGIIFGSHPAIDLMNDSKQLQLTWTDSDGFLSPIDIGGDESQAIAYRRTKTAGTSTGDE